MIFANVYENVMATTVTNSPSFDLIVSLESIERFSTLLQTGLIYQVKKGLSLRAFLNELPGFDMAYIVDRVQTIFLDGNTIDDLETPLVQDNIILAISAAMPGLAGAIFRKNSIHKALRTQENFGKVKDSKKENLTLTLKLFNMIAQEKGKELLSAGVTINGRNLYDFLMDRPSLKTTIQEIYRDKKPVTTNQFISAAKSRKNVRLRIRTK